MRNTHTQRETHMGKNNPEFIQIRILNMQTAQHADANGFKTTKNPTGE